jgi:glutamate-1-semialdehyde 2,1-aminomutase
VQAYRAPGFYDHIRAVGQQLFSGLQQIFTRRGIPARVQGLGARFGIYFGLTDEVTGYNQVQRHSREQMLRFIAAAIEHGVYFHDYGGAACHTDSATRRWGWEELQQLEGRCRRLVVAAVSFLAA